MTFVQKTRAFYVDEIDGRIATGVWQVNVRNMKIWMIIWDKILFIQLNCSNRTYFLFSNKIVAALA